MRLRGWLSASRLLALVAVANVLLGVGLFTLRSPLRQATNAPPTELPAPIRELVDRMDGSHRGESYTLTLSDADLTTAVAYFLATSPDVPFSKVRVTVAGGRVVINGTATGAAAGLPVRATLKVEARDGHPVVQVEKVSLGSTPLPGFIRQQVIDQANASLDLSQYDLGVTVEAITLGTGTITVRGKIT
jgi:hypothetical protein